MYPVRKPHKPETIVSSSKAVTTAPAKQAQTDAVSDEEREKEEKTEEETKSRGVASSPDSLVGGMKKLTASINKLNKDQKNIMKAFGQLKKAFRALSKNMKAVRNMIGGGQ